MANTVYHYVVGSLQPDGNLTHTNGDHNEVDRHLDQWGNDGWRVVHVGVETEDRWPMIILEKPDVSDRP